MGTQVIVQESGAPLMLVIRLKVAGDKLTEIETVSTRTRAEGLSFNIDGLNAPSEEMNFAPRPEQLATREKAIDIALHYPKGLNNADTFAAVGAPFASDAYRVENGALMAGAGCTFNPGCSNISTQPLTIFKRIGPVVARVAAVDERPASSRSHGMECADTAPDKLTVWRPSRSTMARSMPLRRSCDPAAGACERRLELKRARRAEVPASGACRSRRSAAAVHAQAGRAHWRS